MPKKNQEKYKVVFTEGNGGIKLIEKDNIYYLKFPSQICRALWNKPQKLLSLGIKSTDADSQAQAQAIWKRACDDAKSKTGYETLKANYPQYNPKNIYRLIGDDREKCPGLHEICREWFDQKKIKITRLEETTKMHYEDRLRMLQDCPQDLFEMDLIKDWLIQKSDSGVGTALRLLSIIKNSCNWAKQKNRIPESISISFTDWKQDITRFIDKKCPSWAKEKGYFKPNQEYKGFPLKDEQIILESYKEFQWNKKYKPGQFYSFAKLKFLTGCRPGEGLALRWRHFDESDVNEAEGRFGTLQFEESFSRQLKKEKSIKNHKPHRIPCDRELVDFLLEIRPEHYQPNDYIIEPQFKGLERAIFTQDFSNSWHGICTRKDNYQKVGLMEKLLDEGKLSQPIYRSPYATRHTFITRQINAGVPIGTVAAWVGDDPATIAKHYLGADSTRVPIRPSTTQMRPASKAASGTPIDPTTKSENTSSESKLEALEKLCAELLKRIAEIEQPMKTSVS
ncbi:hypothetical protein NDI39_29375 [Microcoleus sp. ZQ-A2]|nr:hypothetical protein [Microcoleus sp. FACHB-1]